MINPRLLILDEATEGPAPLVRAEIYTCLAALKQAGQSILLIDKHLAAVSRLADRVVVLEKGRIAWEGPAASLVADPALVARHLHV
jgi:branched-chain amino acid transport system ATP-binding protein